MDTEKLIKSTINKLRPYLQRDGGDVEYVKFENGIVYVRLVGACVGCSYIDVTLSEGIEAILLEEVPGVIGVEQVE
ncbi:MAG TPA: NifU family protein [Bacilli bacterium]|jgi:Fe-S cluster biogenesis protein NfuA|nr:NifU family protein [Acholeplasmataceae bacterium]OQB64241.1 MAG: Fe/S biogenesis protein NfuA [Tenericutes bacterium ADurb.Bin140]HOE77261.1 NifU family protein [Bacilli bacterium]HON63573.1 NifU family protein [Bacilli bacterium]HOR95683.1 NifU family protein [Bacilli bacterium]